MSSLVKILNRTTFRKINNGLVSLSFVRNHWNKDYLPGVIPQTHEERVKAAKKYNMTVEDYKNFEESEGWGDYPNLPPYGADNKDPFYPWDFPELKRNFNEPLHIDADFYSEDRYNPFPNFRYSMTYMVIVGVGSVIFSFLTFFLFEEIKGFHPLLAKQYPKEGVKHYTFETIGNEN